MLRDYGSGPCSALLLPGTESCPRVDAAQMSPLCSCSLLHPCTSLHIPAHIHVSAPTYTSPPICTLKPCTELQPLTLQLLPTTPAPSQPCLHMHPCTLQPRTQPSMPAPFPSQHDSPTPTLIGQVSGLSEELRRGHVFPCVLTVWGQSYSSAAWESVRVQEGARQFLQGSVLAGMQVLIMYIMPILLTMP